MVTIELFTHCNLFWVPGPALDSDPRFAGMRLDRQGSKAPRHHLEADSCFRGIDGKCL